MYIFFSYWNLISKIIVRILKKKSISYSNFKPSSSNGQSEIQNILVVSLGDYRPFMLQFNGVTTSKKYLKKTIEWKLNSLSLAWINMGSSALIVQYALNDLPNLSPNLVTVTHSLFSDGVSLIYSVQFNSYLGQVQLIEEISGNVNATITRKQSGQSNGKQLQLVIQNQVTSLFGLDMTSSQISSIVSNSFGITCPASILQTKTTFKLFDFENCAWTDDSLNSTAFCGKCSLINSKLLFYSLNSPMNYKYVIYLIFFS